MKLVLCSEGFRTQNSVQACVELCEKPQGSISVAIINECYAVEEGDKYWVVDNLNDVASNFKGGLDIVNLLALPLATVEERIMKCDVIFVVGGNADYLKYIFDKTGFSKLLPKLLKTKVYVGSSAGSMVMGERLSSGARNIVYGKEQATYETSRFLEFIDVAILPHLDSPHFPNRKETLLRATEHHPGVVYGLRDDSAIVIDGDSQKVIGSDPIKIDNGRIVS